MKSRYSVKLILIGDFFSSLLFWTPIILTFLLEKGLSIEKALILISLTQIITLIIEYPTGVISDYYGHKISVVIGRLMLALGFLSYLFLQDFFLMALATGLIALGIAMISGSNTAMLHSASDQFDKDLSRSRSLVLLGAAIGSVIGGFLASYNIIIPVILSILTYAFSALIIIGVKTEDDSKSPIAANIFEQSSLGLKFALKNFLLMSLLIFSSIIVMYTFSLKWIFNSIYEVNNIDVKSLGLLVASIFILQAIGAIKARVFINKKTFIIVLLLILIIVSALIPNIYIVVIIIVSQALLLGIIGVINDIELNNLIDQSVRASVLSFGGLIQKLFSAIYLYLAGILISDGKLSSVMLGTALIITLGYSIYRYANLRSST